MPFFFQSAKHEEIKEWVLAASVDDAHTKELIYDKRRVFEASLDDKRGGTAEPCLVTGYPVIESPIHIGTMMAEKENLNKYNFPVKTQVNPFSPDSSWSSKPTKLKTYSTFRTLSLNGQDLHWQLHYKLLKCFYDTHIQKQENEMKLCLICVSCASSS